MNETDLKIIDKMIKDAWDDENGFCRKLKQYLAKHFSHEEKIVERCTRGRNWCKDE